MLKAPLFKGEIHRLTEPFEHYDLVRHADCFREHARRMQYARFRMAGFPMGGGQC